MTCRERRFGRRALLKAAAATAIGACAEVGGSTPRPNLSDVVADAGLDLGSTEVVEPLFPPTLASVSPWPAPQPCAATTPDLLGPYYLEGSPSGPDAWRLAAPDEAGERLLLLTRLWDSSTCSPLTEVTLELWQADQGGRYYDHKLRSTLRPDADGYLAIDTIVPGRYEEPDGWRPAHLHARLTREGTPDPAIVTQLYIGGDPYLGDADSCAWCKSGDPSRWLQLEPSLWGGQQARVDLVVG